MLDPRFTIAAGKSAAFIADLHLLPTPDTTYDLALRFFDYAGSFDSLFILGDFFEYWIGDDDGLQQYAPIIHALNKLTLSGCQLTVMHGNRDFLLGNEFAQASGAHLVTDDELKISVDGCTTVLLHGDTLCTDDIRYQQFRKKVRDPKWQIEFLRKTIGERHAIARQMRNQSSVESAQKELKIMDVNSHEVQKNFSANCCSTMIHGHTHRPHLHQSMAPRSKRFVVGDWKADHAQYVFYDGDKLSLESFR
ncbi:MAG: UDP-2,3-diacylglucosamine diphosphatase, partial [Granulosicoccus sp.]|nr:UDP-2,3-diacylglucosamine diphosphatase [Granulosicoccus sp.]